MKKILLSAITILSFVVYGIYQKTLGSSSLSNQVIPNSITFKNTPPVNSINSYKDGTYTGNAADAFYGYIQVQIAVNNKKITNVNFLQYPNDRQRSNMINTYAMPILKQEAIQAQNAHVDIVSGATDSSKAFIESLNSALSNAI